LLKMRSSIPFVSRFDRLSHESDRLLERLIPIQGDSVKAREQPDCAVSVVLKSLDGAGWRGRYGFQYFENEASEGENVTRRVAATVGVAVLAENDVLVSMHDLDAPMIAVDAQQSLRRGGGGQARDEMDDLMLRRLPDAVLFDLPPPSDAADLPDRRPLALNPGGFGWQHVNRALFDAAMRLLDAAIPCAQGEKPAR
jgi:hypothetical protein